MTAVPVKMALTERMELPVMTVRQDSQERPVTMAKPVMPVAMA